MTRAAVSVVIPCFQCVATIERSVKSVLNQSRPVSQIILVDDASTDGTLAKLYHIQSNCESNYIQVVHLEKNLGVASARNAGLDVATQNYVAFLDADDAWHPEKIAIQHQWMLEHPEVALTGHRSIQLDEQTSPPQIPLNWSSYPISQIQLLLINRFPARSVMIKRELPYRFLAGKRYAEDYLLWLTIALSGNEVWFLDMALGFTFKKEYGDSGLSGNLWKMEQGELHTYKQIYDKKLISFLSYVSISFYSILKYLRRWCLVKFHTH